MHVPEFRLKKRSHGDEVIDFNEIDKITRHHPFLDRPSTLLKPALNKSCGWFDKPLFANISQSLEEAELAQKLRA